MLRGILTICMHTHMLHYVCIYADQDVLLPVTCGSPWLLTSSWGLLGAISRLSSVHTGATFVSSCEHTTRKKYQEVGDKAAAAVVITTVGYQCFEESRRYACIHKSYLMFIYMPTKMFAYLWHVDLFGRSECQQAFQCRRLPCI